MTEHPLELFRAQPKVVEAKPKHPLGAIDSNRFAKHLVVFKPTE